MGTFESEKSLGGANKILIRHQGEFDFQKLTDSILSWMKNKGYFIDYKDQTEVIRPEGKDSIYEWKTDRQPIPYIKFYIDVTINTFQVNDVVVEVNGKQKKMQTGDLQVRIDGKWEKNYNETFPNTKFGEFLRRLYERYVAFSRLKGYWGKIYGEILELGEVAKKALELNTR